MTKLQQARKAKGLTVLQLALQVGIDPSSMNRIERGIQEIRRDKAYALAEILDVDVLDVIFNKPAHGRAA